MRPETFIVRIYRRGGRRSHETIGLVETPGSTRQAHFRSLAELAVILSAPRAHMRAASEKVDAGSP
jgi:hypothetical protein